MALGYEEKLAEAIGIAEATKYAIFKNLSYKRRKEQEMEAAKRAKLPPLDEETFAIFKLQALDGLPFVGHRTYSSEDYQRAIFLRWGEEVAKAIEKWAQAIIQYCPNEVLENERKFFEECWKRHRDENPLN